MSQHERSKKKTIQNLSRTLAFPTAVLLSGAMVWGGSTAAFSASTTNEGNSWKTGTLTLTDNDGELALFNKANIVPGYEETRCITVTSTSSVDTLVTLSANLAGSEGSEDFISALTVVLAAGPPTGHTKAGSCEGFTPEPLLLPGETLPLTALVTGNTTPGAFAIPLGANASHTYQITVSLPETEAPTSNTIEGKEVSAVFTWEARSNDPTP